MEWKQNPKCMATMENNAKKRSRKMDEKEIEREEEEKNVKHSNI